MRNRLLQRLAIHEYAIGYSEIKEKNDTLLLKDRKQFSFLQPKALKEWYADPFIIEKDGKTFVFMEAMDVLAGKGRIAVSEIRSIDGFTEPVTVIEETFHMSFPMLFTFRGELYMLPETRQAHKLILYRCTSFPFKWERWAETEDLWSVVDSVVIKEKEDMVLMMSRKGSGFETKLLFGKIQIPDEKGGKVVIDTVPYTFVNDVQRYSLSNRNGGGILCEKQGQHIRVAQESTEMEYGVAVVLNRILELNKEKYREEQLKRITPSNIDTDLPKEFHLDGLHTYGKTGCFEIIDLSVSRYKGIGKRLISKMRRMNRR